MTPDKKIRLPGDFTNLGLIIAGGSGSRLWPVSRAEAPKQFHPWGKMAGSLLQETFARLSRSIPPQNIKTVVGRRHEEQTLRHLRAVFPDYPAANLLAEPEGRDSGPAILWGALEIARDFPRGVVTVVWCDQHIAREAVFDQALAQAAGLAAAGNLVAIGVTPTRPETGLGYIKLGEAVEGGGFRVARFLEKPDRPTAEGFLGQGGYAWNAGLFVFDLELLLAEFRRLAPDYVAAFAAGGIPAGEGKSTSPSKLEAVYAGLAPDSIDYLLLEKTDRLLVLPADLGWSDLGAWDVLYREAPKDADGNAIQGNVVTLNTRNSMIHGEHRLIATLGVENLVVVDTEDALLICDMSQTQQVKELVALLNAQQRPEATIPATVHRPWGSFTVLWEGAQFKLKLIEVLPGEKLSVQMHHHRAEHWIVIAGRGEMTCGEETVLRQPKEGFQIPQGARHSVANPGDEPLRFIEVQFGDYLGEDDIVRFEDRYGRV